MSSTYALSSFDKFMVHGPGRILTFRDGTDDINQRHRHVDIQVASGDYFITLATILDGLERFLKSPNNLLVDELVNDLIYLQQNYQISKNSRKQRWPD